MNYSRENEECWSVGKWDHIDKDLGEDQESPWEDKNGGVNAADGSEAGAVAAVVAQDATDHAAVGESQGNDNVSVEIYDAMRVRINVKEPIKAQK